MYGRVYDHLSKGGCIGIFPEGGSNDNPKILPLKAGISIMALGAAQKFKCPMNIVCCGLNYYKPWKFRSSVVLEFSKPIKITEKDVALFENKKRLAITSLLNKILKIFDKVLVQAQTIDEL